MFYNQLYSSRNFDSMIKKTQVEPADQAWQALSCWSHVLTSLHQSSLHRAGFTLNRALFRKKCGGPRAPNTIIGLLLAPTVPNITQNFYLIYYFNVFRAISVCWHVAEFFCSSCGGPIFVARGPVRPNMLNMPKSASVTTLVSLWLQSGKFPSCYKKAQVLPLLKKPVLDSSVKVKINSATPDLSKTA